MPTPNTFINAPLPPQSVLLALFEQINEGVLLFREDGSIAVANSAVRGMLAPAEREAGVDPAKWLRQLLPLDALEQVQAHGHWNGSLPVGERMVIAHVYQKEDAGQRYYLALFRRIEGQEDYERELQQRHAELRQAYLRLNGTQEKLLQSEKMASIGQLAAGVAHEINNPIGYVHSNLGSLQEYLRSLFTVIEAYERALRAPDPKALIPEIDDIRNRFDIDFISRDLPQLMAESREGIERVTRIVRDLKDFSYSGRDESWKLVDLHAGLESTINIIWNELKYKVDLKREFGQLPLVECLPSELNQVYMNLLLNAGHAIAEQQVHVHLVECLPSELNQVYMNLLLGDRMARVEQQVHVHLLLNAGHAIAERGTITVRTGVDGEHVWVEFEDTGGGISPELRQRIFDPFFTTKPVGSGTGLGLSISYSIVNKHHGRIDLDSTPGVGSKFRLVLPIKQPR